MIGGTFTPTADKLAVFADLKEALKNSQLDNWIINYNCRILGFGAEGQGKKIVLFCLWQNNLHKRNTLDLTSYELQPSQPAVVYFFLSWCTFWHRERKIWVILTILS